MPPLLLLAALAFHGHHLAPMPVPLRQPATVRRFAPVELAQALDDAHAVVLGERPSPGRLATVVAMIAHENGKGVAFAWNLGNLGATDPRQPFYLHGGTRYRAMGSLDEGARAYWQIMATRCWRALDLFGGPPIAIAERLARCGFHRTAPAVYAAGIAGLTGEAWRLIEGVRAR